MRNRRRPCWCRTAVLYTALESFLAIADGVVGQCSGGRTFIGQECDDGAGVFPETWHLCLRDGFGARELIEDGLGIAVDTIHQEFIVQVWSGGTAGGAHITDDVVLLDL